MGETAGSSDRKVTPLEIEASNLGFHRWDPNLGTYDSWEYAIIRHCSLKLRKDVKTDRDWYVGRSFRPHMLDIYLRETNPVTRTWTDLEGNAKALGFRLWDPNVEGYDEWELAFIKHCIRTTKVKGTSDTEWFLKQGFRPGIVASQLTMIDRERQTRNRERRSGFLEMVGFKPDEGVSLIPFFFLVAIGCAGFLYFLSEGNVGGAVLALGLSFFLALGSLKKGSGDGMSDGPDF